VRSTVTQLQHISVQKIALPHLKPVLIRRPRKHMKLQESRKSTRLWILTRIDPNTMDCESGALSTTVCVSLEVWVTVFNRRLEEQCPNRSLPLPSCRIVIEMYCYIWRNIMLYNSASASTDLWRYINILLFLMNVCQHWCT